MASAPSSWKTLFKFLLEECFQKATLQMSWCTPSLAKPQIYFSFSEFHLAEPTQSSRHRAQKAAGSEQEPFSFGKESWRPLERGLEAPGAAWPPGQELPRKSCWAAPSTFLPEEGEQVWYSFLHSCGDGLRETWAEDCFSLSRWRALGSSDLSPGGLWE